MAGFSRGDVVLVPQWWGLGDLPHPKSPLLQPVPQGTQVGLPGGTLNTGRLWTIYIFYFLHFYIVWVFFETLQEARVGVGGTGAQAGYSVQEQEDSKAFLGQSPAFP